MLTLQEAKEFLRVDGDDEDALISSLLVTAKDLTEDVMRRKLSDFEEMPEPVRQAMLILVATLYEERQVSKGKTGVSVADTLDLVRRMLFVPDRTASVGRDGNTDNRSILCRADGYA